jgi:hypothetical protein
VWPLPCSSLTGLLLLQPLLPLPLLLHALLLLAPPPLLLLLFAVVGVVGAAA